VWRHFQLVINSNRPSSLLEQDERVTVTVVQSEATDPLTSFPPDFKVSNRNGENGQLQSRSNSMPMRRSGPHRPASPRVSVGGNRLENPQRKGPTAVASELDPEIS